MINIFNSSYCQQNGNLELFINAGKFFEKADSLFRISNYDSALMLYRKANYLYGKSLSWKEVVKCQLQIAQTYQIKGQFDSTFYSLRKSEDIQRNFNVEDNKLRITFYYLMGTTFNKIGKIDSSIFYLNKSSNLFSFGSNDSLEVLVKKSLGNANFSMGKYDEALQQYKEALNKEILRRDSSELIQAALVQNIGIVFTTLGEYDSARIYLNRSIVLKEKNLPKNDPQLAFGYNNYGRFLYIVGYPDEALDYLSKAEEIYISIFGPDYFLLAPIYFNKGSIFIVLRNFNKALSYHERALELYKKSTYKNNPIISELIMNIGIIYEQQGDLDKAIYFYKESLKENVNSESVIKSYRSLARCFHALNDYNNAESNL